MTTKVCPLLEATRPIAFVVTNTYAECIKEECAFYCNVRYNEGCSLMILARVAAQDSNERHLEP